MAAIPEAIDDRDRSELVVGSVNSVLLRSSQL